MTFEQLQPNPKNPRTISADKFKQLKASLKQFPQMLVYRPIVYQPDGVVLGGNMRLKALQELATEGFQVRDEYFRCADELTEDQKRRFIIEDNVPFGDWDWEVLTRDWDAAELKAWGLDVPDAAANELGDDYSQKLGEVVYEPKDTHHAVSELFFPCTQYDADIAAIQNPELRLIFQARAAWLGRFDFAKLADYYAYQATPEEQRLFEKLALVLLDKDQLIQHGYSKLIEDVTKDWEGQDDADTE